jgi:hypothetical protein
MGHPETAGCVARNSLPCRRFAPTLFAHKASLLDRPDHLPLPDGREPGRRWHGGGLQDRGDAASSFCRAKIPTRRRCSRPASCPSCTPLPHFASRTVSERWARWCTAIRGDFPSTPEVLAPVWVLLSQSFIAYSTSSVPLVGTSRHRLAVYTECLRCAGAPRRPASGSVLSLCVPS